MPSYQIEYQLSRAADGLPPGNRTATLSAPNQRAAIKSLGAVLSLREGLMDATFRVRKVTPLAMGDGAVRRLP